MRVFTRWFEAIAPDETAHTRALPLTLLVRPLPLFALVVLAVNDHVWKGSGLLPGVVTGKLSDFAGLFYFPLLLVTLANLTSTLFARVFRRDALLEMGATTRMLALACLATALVFTAIKISTEARDVYVRVVALLQWWNHTGRVAVVVDPTDLIALPMIAFAFVWGRRAIARVPPGRLEMARARVRRTRSVVDRDDDAERVVHKELADVKAANPSARRVDVDALARAIAVDDVDAIDACLARLRA